MKTALFILIVVVVLGITGLLVWSTILTNVSSVTGGPVHYHADFEIYNCGEKIDLIDPEGWDNKVGTSLLHEHNDNRIHVEGPVMDFNDISLGNFFKVVGGGFTSDLIKIPTNTGLLTLESGTICNGESATLQVFVYKTYGNILSQEKLKNPQIYILSPHSKVPPGDCIIIELDREKEKTDRICTFYEVALQKGELK